MLDRHMVGNLLAICIGHLTNGFTVLCFAAWNVFDTLNLVVGTAHTKGSHQVGGGGVWGRRDWRLWWKFGGRKVR